MDHVAAKNEKVVIHGELSRRRLHGVRDVDDVRVHQAHYQPAGEKNSCLYRLDKYKPVSYSFSVISQYCGSVNV